jgi:hypothetical protein
MSQLRRRTNRYMSSLRSYSFCESRGWKCPESLRQANARGVLRMRWGKNNLLLKDGVVVCDKNELMRP